MAIDRSLSLVIKFAALDRLTGKMRTIGGSAKKTAADIAETRREIDRLQKAQAKVGAFRDMENRFRASASAIEEQRAKLAGLRAEHGKAEGSTKRLTSRIEAAERKEARLIAQHEKHGIELQGLSRDLDRAGVDVAELARHEERLGNELHDTNKRLQQQRQELEKRGRVQARAEKVQAVGGKIQGMGMAAGIAGTAITVPLGFAVREAIDFESAMSDVRKVVDGMEDPRAFKSMGRDILQLSRELPIAAEGLAQIVAAGGQAGLAGNELLPFARNAAQMGVAFDIDPDKAGETMAKWRTAFRLGQREVVQLADKVNWLSDKTAAAPDQISAIVTRVGPLGEVAGLAAGEIAAMGATLASMGVQEEIAATGIKNTMLALTKGEAATKSQKKAFGLLGLESTAVAKSMQRDATGTIMTVMQKIAALPDYQRASILDQLFGSESISAIAPLLTQLPTLATNLEMVGDRGGWAGSMMREFDSRSATSAARLAKFNNRVNALKIGIGERLLPVIEKGAELFGRWADRASAWMDANPKLASGLLTLVGAIGAFLVVAGGLGLVVGPIVTGIGWLMKLGGVLSFILSPLRLVAQAALWGIGAIAAFVGLPAWIVGAIAIALIAAGVLIWNNWEKIKGWFVEGARFLTNLRMQFLKIGAQLMMGLITGISSKLSALRDKIVGLGKQAVGWFKGVLGIKSPSRVFMGLGGYMTQGLTMGLERGADEPIARMRRLAGQVTAALAIGSAGMTPAAAAPPGGGGGGRPAIIQHLAISITIHAQPGEDTEELAEKVAAVIERKSRAAAASDYGDND
ncbi:phage tail tape measure protein [Sphingomonas sp. R647]|uniref:phage tail tape measure protein n=1 Tax=Sphingomonas sp. R647 TaxID=2875233 RepID=UPI001CD77B01|nr:phage tail tape measure protein [Sphingomonas sp. R647]MCA1199150.1 phage tail tape measure protein [Sphingomonas sp. R647]